MRLVIYILPLALAACSAASADPIEESKACVASAAQTEKVSAARAREIVARCQAPIAKWADNSMLHACRGECDYRDARNVQERVNRKAKIEETLMMSISDEVHPKFVRM